jgi:hypothetical protein
MTIELRTDPSSHRHWQLSVDRPVAMLTPPGHACCRPAGDYELKLDG